MAYEPSSHPLREVDPLSTYWEVRGCVVDPVGWVKIRSFSLLVNSISSAYLSRIPGGGRKEVLP